MSAPRLLILADPKMLPALAGGLREGGRFDVIAASFADPGAAQAAVERADAVALFYGAPGTPLSGALQALAPKLRERGGRVVAVLQREQAAQRDECFRAGASDLLFMPIPKDQFVARLATSVALAFSQDGGASAAVTVATRGSTSRLDRAAVSALGVEAPVQLPIKAGETVRLSWAGFQAWGLVVRGAPSTQIRFAGLAPDEEAKIREWVKTGGAHQPAAAANSPPRAQPPEAAPQSPATATPPQPAPAQAPAPRAPAPPSGRAAPGAGPPPGFGDRPATTRAPPRPAPRPATGPIAATPAGNGAHGTEKAAPAAAPPAKAPRAQNGPAGLEGLFDGQVGAAAPAPAGAAPPRPTVPQGPPWPAPVAIAVCKSAALQLLANDTVGGGVPGPVAASARKVTGMLSVGERAWIEHVGAESHFADALAARIALDAATAEATRLAAGGSTPVVDAESLAALTKTVDEAAGRLQKEANEAIGKGEVESLQLITAASAALSRDLLNLKETADKLRGIGAAPRMGAGALDPDVILPGQQPRPRPPPTLQAAPAPVKAELRDFRGLDHKPRRGKEIFALLILVGAVAAAAHGFYFGTTHRADVSVQGAGDGVQHISLSGGAAVVTVSQDWVAGREARLPRLLQVLRANQVKKAVLMLPDGSSVGMVDVVAGKAIGITAAAK